MNAAQVNPVEKCLLMILWPLAVCRLFVNIPDVVILFAHAALRADEDGLNLLPLKAVKRLPPDGCEHFLCKVNELQ